MNQSRPIISDSKIMGGQPCISGTRIPVDLVLGYLSAGRSHAEILADLSDLKEADIQSVLSYAAAKSSTP